jgi:dihydrofolate reductase
MIGMIAAVTRNGVIGINNRLPFNYKEDLAHFKKVTTNTTVIMGRNTFESIGKPLPNRNNIIISNSIDFKLDNNLIIENSLESAIKIAKNYNNSIWLIGGASVYQKGMEVVDKIILTITPDYVDDVNSIKFPWINPMLFIQNEIEILSKDKNLHVLTYTRKN